MFAPQGNASPPGVSSPRSEMWLSTEHLDVADAPRPSDDEDSKAISESSRTSPAAATDSTHDDNPSKKGSLQCILDDFLRCAHIRKLRNGAVDLECEAEAEDVHNVQIPTASDVQRGQQRTLDAHMEEVWRAASIAPGGVFAGADGLQHDGVHACSGAGGDSASALTIGLDPDTMEELWRQRVAQHAAEQKFGKEHVIKEHGECGRQSLGSSLHLPPHSDQRSLPTTSHGSDAGRTLYSARSSRKEERQHGRSESYRPPHQRLAVAGRCESYVPQQPHGRSASLSPPQHQLSHWRRWADAPQLAERSALDLPSRQRLAPCEPHQQENPSLSHGDSYGARPLRGYAESYTPRQAPQLPYESSDTYSPHQHPQSASYAPQHHLVPYSCADPYVSQPPYRSSEPFASQQRQPAPAYVPQHRAYGPCDPHTTQPPRNESYAPAVGVRGEHFVPPQQLSHPANASCRFFQVPTQTSRVLAPSAAGAPPCSKQGAAHRNALRSISSKTSSLSGWEEDSRSESPGPRAAARHQKLAHAGAAYAATAHFKLAIHGDSPTRRPLTRVLIQSPGVIPYYASGESSSSASWDGPLSVPAF